MKHFIFLFATILALYGCGTSDDGGAAGVGGSGGTGGTAGAGGIGGQGGTGGSTAQCPNPVGNFGNPVFSGTGCGELSNMATQQIQTTATQCQFNMSSGVVMFPGLNGPFLLDMAGTFSNTTFTVGTGQLTGCDGTWNDNTKTMDIDCTNCMITLTRVN